MPKTGYHYTSWKNWQSIQKYGMRIYPILKDELLEYFDAYPKGIWVWENSLEPESELGTILFQLSTKASTKVVKLAVTYTDDDVLYYEGNFGRQKIRLLHSGNMEKWEYHKDSPEAIIVTSPVDITNIKLLKVYDLMDIVRESNE